MSSIMLTDFVFIFLFLLLSTHQHVHGKQLCFNKTVEKLEFHFGTKTPYRIVANQNDTPINYNGCEPNKIWTIIRHGTRNPSGKTIKKMLNNLFSLQRKILRTENNEMCEKDLSDLRQWNFHIDIEEKSFLTLEGMDEMIELAERMQKRFPNLLSDYYDNSTYKFKFTNTQRTRKSFEGFATGLFGRQNLKQIWYAEPLHRDPILRFYKLCKRWKVHVKNGNKTTIEKDNFFNGNIMNNLRLRMTKKLDISDVTLHDIHLIYITCAFETASNKFSVSPWCRFLDAKSVKLLEYFEDLKYYWIDGYGHELTAKQACPVIIDVLKHFESANDQIASFYFTHSGAILKILAHLGLYRDELTLAHHNLDENRKWKVSQIDAFGSNIAFVLYKCVSGFHILTLHQERIVRLPGCPHDSDLCHLDVFKSIYKESLENCLFDEMCHV